ncbi:Rad4-domain-containing protein [Suillus clintonianus]|uniref:Rad4-domain-containing protein n=1 Tax=Suillus clintonianus TaxID=1904413 RepID=UPI001B86407A|nr:Rad4-domain-containing protein [Suillus clintonianus]KAG2121095.1 Rad4-domain-containing protein [Suillus clintonianus]
MMLDVSGDSSDEDFEWEEVDVPQQIHETNPELELQLEGPAPRANIEITLHSGTKKKDDSKKAAAAAARAQRILRTGTHKVHTVCLLANARVRNKWLNDELLHARLLSLTPLHLQNSFALIHKSRVPDQNKRGRLFETTVTRLVEWWTGTFFCVLPTGHIRNRTFDENERELALRGNAIFEDEESDDGERIRSPNSLMKHALMQSGSRDTSAQLFTALCRALDIPARLVTSLQSIPWQSGVGKPKLKPANKNRPPSGQKGKQRAGDTDVLSQDSEFEDAKATNPQSPAAIETNLGHSSPGETSTQAKGKGKGKGKEKARPVIYLRKPKNHSENRAGTPIRPRAALDPTTTPPIFWTEVFSRADGRWLPVDPIRGFVNKRHVFDPSAENTFRNGVPQENRMVYVVALEEDGFGRDVTARYAKDYTAKVAKVQRVGIGRRKEWWDGLVRLVTRPYRLQRDETEDAELYNHQLTEGMPTTVAGFKGHPLYALSRHLNREEVIDPPVELGKFRGEPVYPRSSVISLKTAENWMRQGRVVREGCQPMKMVKQRAVTIGRKREMELALEKARTDTHGGDGQEDMQGLYARSQTELYMPKPVVDGKVPKNDFGNIDLYVPSMLPEGSVHIPFKGVAKVAKRLGFDYAEAVTGFEFRNRRAIPIIEGIVVAEENETIIVEAFLEAENDAEEKARVKRLDQVHKRWIRLVQGLRIRDRLRKQYASNTDDATPQHWLDTQNAEAHEGEQQPGGFLTTADDVVKPFHLPKNQHTVLPSSLLSSTTGDDGAEIDEAVPEHSGVAVSYTHPRGSPLHFAEDVQMGEVSAEVPSRRSNAVPKSMRELAEDDLRRRASEIAPSSSDEPERQSRSTPAERTTKGGRVKALMKSGTNTPSKRNSSVKRKNGKKRIREDTDSASEDDHRFDNAASTRDGNSSKGNSATTPGRVLRPRPQKNTAKLREEAELERAFRRAIAE